MSQDADQLSQGGARVAVFRPDMNKDDIYISPTKRLRSLWNTVKESHPLKSIHLTITRRATVASAAREDKGESPVHDRWRKNNLHVLLLILIHLKRPLLRYMCVQRKEG